MSVSEIVNFVFSEKAALIRPWQFREELAPALVQVAETSPRNILEIGTANGGTLFCWCRIADTGGKIISIDLPEGKFGGGYPGWKKPYYEQFIPSAGNLHLLRLDSGSQPAINEVSRILDGEKLDLLFIDGDHTYEGVKRDFTVYSRFVRDGGLIMLHDIVIHPGSACKVDLFWNEIKKEYPHWEYIRDPNQGMYGIGLLKWAI